MRGYQHGPPEAERLLPRPAGVEGRRWPTFFQHAAREVPRTRRRSSGHFLRNGELMVIDWDCNGKYLKVIINEQIPTK